MIFRSNQEYHRQDLLNYVQSKQIQSGIIWGPKEPGCVIITSGGKHGKSAGYGDEKQGDGTWIYIGQGSEGDQNPNSAANSLLTKQQRNILLFSTREPTSPEARARGNRKKLYKFEGIYDVLAWDLKRVTNGDRKGDKLVFFHLVPANNIFNDFEVEAVEAPLIEPSLAQLLQQINNKSTLGKSLPGKKMSYGEYRERSLLVKTYALLRAKGICELCNTKAPFITSFGTPFLEVHHILKLADDGPDLPQNVAALCPNCHREAHLGEQKDLIKSRLKMDIEEKENLFSQSI